MNARILISLACFAGALGSYTSAATPAADVPRAFNVTVAYSARHTPIRIGATETDVLESLGAPLRHSSSNTWIYTNFRVKEPSVPQSLICDRLVVTFDNRVVTDLKLMNCKAATMVDKAARGGSRVAYVMESPNLRVAGR